MNLKYHPKLNVTGGFLDVWSLMKQHFFGVGLFDSVLIHLKADFGEGSWFADLQNSTHARI